jgi:hypothetical protein
MNQIYSFFERAVQGKSNPLAHYRLILRLAPIFFHQLNGFLDLVHEIKKNNSLSILIFMYTKLLNFLYFFFFVRKEIVSNFLLHFNTITIFNKINRRLEMRVFIPHPFFIRLSEQKYWMQRNENFWYIKPRSDSYKSK